MFGEFAIGESAIGESGGFVNIERRSGFDFFKTIISQYANSPVLLSLIGSITDAIDPTPEIDEFYRLIWNIETAQGYGLDVWGRIIGVGRVFQLPAPGAYLGFDDATDAFPFGEGIFFGGGNLTQNYALSDTAYRRVLYAKALSNICDGSIPAINKILRLLFGGYGNCFVVDNQNMTMVYSFGSSLSPVDLAIATQSGILPKPSGVSVSIVQN